MNLFLDNDLAEGLECCGEPREGVQTIDQIKPISSRDGGNI